MDAVDHKVSGIVPEGFLHVLVPDDVELDPRPEIMWPGEDSTGLSDPKGPGDVAPSRAMKIIAVDLRNHEVIFGILQGMRNLEIDENGIESGNGPRITQVINEVLRAVIEGLRKNKE